MQSRVMAHSHRALGIRVSKRRRPLESSVEGPCVKEAVVRGCLTYKLSSLGRRGKDDRLFITPNGCCWFVEFKRPGEKPRKLQVIEHAKILERGQMHSVIDARDDFTDQLGVLLRLKKRGVPRSW